MPSSDPVRVVCPSRRPRTALRLARCAAVVFAVLWTIAVAPASAHGRGDHDRARDALAAGEVLPLEEVLDRLQRTIPGRVLDVELEREDGRWVYQVKLMRPGGRLSRVDLDARTAEVLRSRERERRHGGDGDSR
jgi:uncharacterized membrane protein YkoI